MRTVRVRVTGEVQGVFFRASTREYALPLGLVGYAKNLLDGAVELMLTGERRQIDQLLVWLKKEGPSMAQIESIVEHEVPLQLFDQFSVY
jgi:acylphosphatase